MEKEKEIRTVKDLIEELKKYDENTIVLCGYRDGKGIGMTDCLIEVITMEYDRFEDDVNHVVLVYDDTK